MNKYNFYILLLILVSCSTSNSEKNISFLNGYWEIEKVVLADGSEKQYNFNQTIDFFEVKDSTGLRKKLQPQLDGTFVSTNDSETFRLKFVNDSLQMHYRTLLSNWKETIISLKEDKMVIKNEAQNLYFYKRYKKLDL